MKKQILPYEQACVVCGKWMKGETGDYFDYIICGNEKCQSNWKVIRSKLFSVTQIRGSIWYVCPPNKQKVKK